MNSSDISISTDFSAQEAVLRELMILADANGVNMLVVGALARDLMIRGVTGAAPDRMTADIDVAVAVPSWSTVAALTQGLTPGPKSRTTRCPQARNVSRSAGRLISLARCG